MKLDVDGIISLVYVGALSGVHNPSGSHANDSTSGDFDRNTQITKIHFP